MFKKIYFICSSIAVFILSIISMFLAPATVEATINSIREISSELPESLVNRLISIYENSGVQITIFFSIVLAIISIILLVTALNNALLRHKGAVITLIVLMMFFTDSALVQLIAIASLIIILCSKRKTAEDYPKEVNKKIVKLELKKCSFKDYILGILVLALYFSQFIWAHYIPNDFFTRLLIEIVFNLIMLFSCIFIFYDEIKYNFKIFKSNFKVYIKYVLSRLGIAYLLLFVASFISTLITKNSVSENQQTLEALPIYYLLPAAIIYAPIVEEILFRGIIRRFIKSDILFIIVSAIVFGVLHTIGESSLLEIIIMALPYSVLGGYLAYTYVKTNNIFTNITTHSIFNTISSILILLMK